MIGKLLPFLLPCNQHIKSSPVFLLILLPFLLSWGENFAQYTYVEQQTPRIVGSMPSDGSEGIIRNAFIAVGLDVGDQGVGIDLSTVTEENIKLYPASDPSAPIKSFLASSQIPLNITVEPLHVLAPNTQYVFEITDSLKDLSGRPFPPYKITFTTGELSQPKFITMKRRKPRRVKGFRPKNDPNILPAGPKFYAEPEEQAIAISDQVEEAETNNTKIDSTNTQETPISDSSPVASSAQIKKVPIEPDVTTLPVPTSEEESISAAQIKEEEAPKQLFTEGVDFPKTRIPSGSKLPVTFVMLEKKSVKYMIKNPSGKIVKRGASTLNPGTSGKGIDVSTLIPGRYRISVKVEEKIVHHTFVILK